jgi:MYXO-CTERM domain-containing protein
MAGWTGDPWRSDFNDGVMPVTDVKSLGPFGVNGPWDNYLVNGDPTWSNVMVSAKYRTFDDDMVGVIARWQDPENFYVCFVTQDGEVGPTGWVEFVGPRAVLARIRDGQVEHIERRTDIDGLAVPGEVHTIEIRTIYDEVSCYLDPTGDDDVDVPILEGTDADPIASGLGGLFAVDSMELNPQAWMDDFTVDLSDIDDDLLADDLEVIWNTDPYDPDTDGDLILDGTEVFGNNPTIPMNPDTDHGGVPDGVEDADQDGEIDPGETDPNLHIDDDPNTRTIPEGEEPGEFPIYGVAGSGACQVAPQGSAPGPAGIGVLMLLGVALLQRRRRRG